MMSERNGMPPECNGGDLEGSQSAPGSATGSPRVEAFSWLQSAEKHGAPTPSFGWLSKPKAYTIAASTGSSPGSTSSPATPPQAPPERANSDPFKRATTAAARPLQYLDKLSRVEVEQPPRRSHGQVERVWSDTDNSPTEVELSVDNDIDSTPASPTSQRMLWMPLPPQGRAASLAAASRAGELPLFTRPKSLPAMRPTVTPSARSNARAAPTLVGSPTADEELKRRADTAREAATAASDARAAALRMAAEADEAEEALRNALHAVQGEGQVENLDSLDPVDSLTVDFPARPPNCEALQLYRSGPEPHLRAAQGWADRRPPPSSQPISRRASSELSSLPVDASASPTADGVRPLTQTRTRTRTQTQPPPPLRTHTPWTAFPPALDQRSLTWRPTSWDLVHLPTWTSNGLAASLVALDLCTLR